MLSRLLTRKEQAVLVVFGAAIVVGATVLFTSQREPGDRIVRVEPASAAAIPAAEIVKPSSPAAAPTAASAAISPPTTPASVVVSVQGAVKKAGVYTLSEGDRVQDLLELAGGALDDSNLININLAARLVDGTTLIVPSWNPDDYWTYQAAANPPQYTILQQNTAAMEPSAPASAEPQMPSRAAGGTSLINLNTATQEQLESLPGIGPTYAKEIIRTREQSPFRAIEDVMQVRGIGEKRLEAIRPLITIE